MVPPSDVCWFINPMNISTINHSEMGVMFTNLANELGHHLVVNMSFFQQLDRLFFLLPWAERCGVQKINYCNHLLNGLVSGKI